MRSVLILCGIIALAQSVTEQDFFPFGTENGDQVTPNTKGGYVGPITLNKPFGVGYSTLVPQYNTFVHNDGILSFMEAVQGDVQPTCTRGRWGQQLVVLPYWAHTDLSQGLGGTVYYRQSNDQSLFDRANQEIKAIYPYLDTQVNINNLLIVTWYQVPFEGASACGLTNATVPRNTFQAVLAGNDELSFVIFFYANLTWTAGSSSGGDCNGRASPPYGFPAVAGWGDTNGDVFPIYDSCDVNAPNMAQENDGTDAPGKWVISLNGYWDGWEWVTQTGEAANSNSLRMRMRKGKGRKIHH